MTTITRRAGVTAVAGTGPRLAVLKNIMNNPRAVSMLGLVASYGAGSTAERKVMLTGGPLSNCRTYLRVQWSVPPTGATSSIQIRNGADGLNAVVPGKTYAVKVYVRASSALTVAPKMGWFQGVTYVSAFSGEPVKLVANKWTQLTVKGECPAGASRLQVNTDPTATSIPLVAGSIIDATGWFSYETTPEAPTGADGAPDYADGDTTGWSWVGTPHESAAQGYGAIF